MNKSADNIEIIDRLLANERKLKKWTIYGVLIFCVIGIVIVVLSYKLNQSNAKFKVQNIELEKTQEKLRLALAELDAYTTKLQIDSATLSGSLVSKTEKYDSVKHVLDTVVNLFNKSQESYISGTSAAVAADRIESISREVYPTQGLSDDIKKLIINPERMQAIQQRSRYTVSVYYMPEFKETAALLAKLLQENNFDVKTQESAAGMTFNPVVKYFNEPDLRQAERLMDLVRGLQLKNAFTIERQDLNIGSDRQLEVWIGEYRPKDIKQIIQHNQYQPIRKEMMQKSRIR
jgi:hypothetical protein